MGKRLEHLWCRWDSWGLGEFHRVKQKYIDLFEKENIFWRQRSRNFGCKEVEGGRSLSLTVFDAKLQSNIIMISYVLDSLVRKLKLTLLLCSLISLLVRMG